MARWAPGARDRLEQAAIELFAEKGFEATTVAGIAARAGVTERTFFRHYADKREVLFSGESELTSVFVDAVATAQPGASAPALMSTAIDAGARMLQEARGRDFARRRDDIISANAALQERELLKLTKLSRTLADAMTVRGVDAYTARAAAQLGIAVFTTAFAGWIAPTETRSLVDVQHEVVAAFRSLLPVTGSSSK